MASDLEKEAAKLIERLIQESKDDPPKLATKLCLLCDYMKMKGKENTMPFRGISRVLESVVNQNGLDMNALMEAAPRHFIRQCGEGASGGNTSKEIEMITNRVHAHREEASGKSAQPCAGHVTAEMKKPIPTFGGLEENMQKAVAVKRKAGSSGSTAGEERKNNKQEELMPPLSKIAKVDSPQQQNPEEAPPAKKTPGNVSPKKQEGTAPTLPSVQAISPPIPPTEEQCSSSPSAASCMPQTRQRKMNNTCVQPSNSSQDPPRSRKGKETVGDIVQLTNGDAVDKNRLPLEEEKIRTQLTFY